MKQKRFTLLELMGTLFIISVLSLYTIPKFISLQEKMEMERFISELNKTLYDSQLQSMEEKSSYGLQFTPDGYVKVNSNYVPQSSLTSYPNNIYFRSSSFDKNTIFFTEDGSPVSAGSIQFRYGKEMKTVKLQIQPANGRVKTIWE